MNTLHFKYSVEVERCGSITQAAENLYMAQPNLSKSIKELEDTLGFQIFARTSRGVVPTARGREFLVYARGILNQLQAMEALSQRHDDATQRFSLSMPRAGYIADCFSALVDSLDKGSPMDIRVREASALHTINDVADGQFQLGIFRTESKDAGYYLNYLREKSLQYEPVWEYDALLLLSQEHPLAAHDRIEPENLTPYTQIIYGDLAVPYLPASDALRADEPPSSRIQVYGRLEQLDLLSRLPDTYMWASPETPTALRRFSLVMRKCFNAGMRYQDILIYPTSYQLSALDRRFISLLSSARARLSHQAYT